jgi:hypothetical protein
LRLGCSGDFEIIVDSGNSKADILYKIELKEEKNIPANIIFKLVEDKEYKAGSLKELFEIKDFLGILKINENNKKVYKIYWEWLFENYLENGDIDEEKDILDTEYAKHNLDYIFEIKITGEQVK